MQNRTAYEITPVANIQRALTLARDNLKSSNVHRTVVSANVILLAQSFESLKPLEDLVSRVARVHPGRFFLLGPDKKSPSLEVWTALELVSLSKSELVCSEIVKLKVPVGSEAMLANVLRGNLLSGVKTEVVVASAEADQGLIDELAKLAQVLVFDSGELEQHSGLVEHILGEATRAGAELVDLQWVGLGSLREQTKLAFSHPSVLKELPGLTQIRVQVRAEPQMTYAACALLLSAWVVNRLGLQVRSFGRLGFDCIAPSGKMVQLSFEAVASAVPKNASQVPEIAQLTFVFDAGLVQLKVGDLIETEINFAERHKVSAPVDSGDRDTRLVRYYEIGESLKHYRDALLTAIEIDDLQKGFRVC